MRQIVWAIVALGLVSTPALAQETTGSLGLGKQSRTLIFAPRTLAAAQAPVAADEPSKVTVIVGSDFPSDYVWRGILQENEGFIAQPFVDVGIAATDKVAINVGMWNSLHSAEFTGTFYEADYYGQVTFTSGKWKPALLFTSYTNPQGDQWDTINELAGVVTYDDSGSSFPLAPKFILGLDLGEGNPTYFEVGVTPSTPLGSATLSIPVKLGLSLHDFYDDTFGYFQVGGKIGVSIPTSGSFAAEVHGGVDILVLGDSVRWDKKAEPVFNVGISLTFN